MLTWERVLGLKRNNKNDGRTNPAADLTPNKMNTNTALTKPQVQNQKPSALAVMASKFSVDPAKLLETLKATVFKNASNEELLALVVVANQYDLSPFLKEIYAFPAKGGGIVPIVSVDGWNKMLLRQPDFDGIEFEFEHIDHEAGRELISCTATVYAKNRSKPVKVTEYLEECKRNTDPWNNMPHRMLRNRTLCQAARVAFGFSGIHDEDEAQAIVIESVPVPGKQLAPIPAVPDPDHASLKSPQEELADFIVSSGFTFDQFKPLAMAEGWIVNPDAVNSFGEMELKESRRLLRAKDGLLKAMQKGAQ